MKNKFIFAALVSSLFVFDVPAQEFEKYGYAKVLSVVPITSTGYNTVPRTTCSLVQTYNNSNPSAIPVEKCSTYHDKQHFTVVNGYNVTFEFEGELRTVVLDNKPGSRLPIKIVKRVYVLE